MLCGSSTDNIGIDLFMDFMVAAMPSPLDCRARKSARIPATKKEIERRPRPRRTVLGPGGQDHHRPLCRTAHHLPGVLRVPSAGTARFYNAKKEVRERYNQLLVILGKEQKPMDGAGPGSIVAVAKLKETGTGDTLCDEAGQDSCSRPCTPIPTLISYALSAKTKGDEDKVFTSLTRLLEEDSSLRIDRLAETKEIILHGHRARSTSKPPSSGSSASSTSRSS